MEPMGRVVEGKGLFQDMNNRNRGTVRYKLAELGRGVHGYPGTLSSKGRQLGGRKKGADRMKQIGHRKKGGSKKGAGSFWREDSSS